MNTRKTLSTLFFALTIAVGFVACSDNDSFDQEVNPVSSTTLRLVFKDSLDTSRSAGSKVDLTKASFVKIEYAVNEEGNDIEKEATLMVKGDSTQVTTFDQKDLTFKSGSKLEIYSAALYDSKSDLIGTWAKNESDVFEVTSSEGASVMDRVYGTVGIDRSIAKKATITRAAVKN